MMNDANTCLIMCKMSAIHSSSTTNLYTRMTGMEETFFLVPIKHFDVWYKTEHIWKKRTLRHNFVGAE